MSDVLTPKKEFMPLWIQIVIGSIIGGIFGFLQPEVGVKAKFLGDLFIRLIQMTIIPLVFPLIVLGIAKMHSGKAIGRLAFKSIVYFEVVTTFLLAMPMALVNIFNVGVGADLGTADPSILKNFTSRSIDFTQFLIDIVPRNVVAAAAEGKLLPVLFFGIFFGLALAHIAEVSIVFGTVLNKNCSTMSVLVVTIAVCTLLEIPLSFMEILMLIPPVMILGLESPGIPGGAGYFMSPVIAALLNAPDQGVFITTFVTLFSGLIPMFSTAGNTTDDGVVGALLQDRFYSYIHGLLPMKTHE